eukprot:CAMPEP_0170738456 /NCGR_PEP_ID=MMETSP0437-20130122/4654_1 /TAXON_ID=0 /ORGANISM="Sexangularia sp." /LENGTH=152 /DNA_ID=CAMNT_0011076879 /DNA_START=54 /DNA_END=512 /DNA_ORIENTATION=+
MLMPKKDRRQIYEHLFKEGVIVASAVQRDHIHQKIGVPNVFVVQLMRSFTSKEFVRHTYNWRYHYYYLTNEGVEYLREYLHLPSEIVPKTLMAGPAHGERSDARRERGDRGDRGDRADRGRGRGGDAGKKQSGPGANWKPNFAGAGRGQVAA